MTGSGPPFGRALRSGSRFMRGRVLCRVMRLDQMRRRLGVVQGVRRIEGDRTGPHAHQAKVHKQNPRQSHPASFPSTWIRAVRRLHGGVALRTYRSIVLACPLILSSDRVPLSSPGRFRAKFPC